MLRISIVDDSRSSTLRAEGKLAHEWVDEARRTWHALRDSNRSQQRELVIDLAGVDFVDEPGRQLLAEMHDSGVKFISTGPMIARILEELSTTDQAPTRSGWKKAFWSFFFLMLVCACGRLFGEGPGIPVLTLTEAVEQAKAHNRELKIQQMQAAISGADVATPGRNVCLPSLQISTRRACWLPSHSNSTVVLSEPTKT